jgi:hypothetical protein
MNNCSDADHMEIQSETKTPNDLSYAPYELNLLDDLQKIQSKTEKEVDQKESNESESGVDLQKLFDETYIQDDKTKSTSDNELMCDNEIFGDVLTKMKAFVDESKQEKLEKNILIREWQIFNDFFNLIEKYEKNLTDEDLLVGRTGLKLVVCTTDNIDLDDMFTNDLVYAKEIFYMYFNLINIGVIQNYLKNGQMPDYLKILYRICIPRILQVMNKMAVFIDLSFNDLQRPTNSVQLLSLMLNYVKTDFKSSDLTSNPLLIDVSITRELILSLIWSYADNTVLVRDLIEIGCLEMMINELTMICK